MGYKVKVKNKTSEFFGKSCFLGISITNPIYTSEIKVCKIIDWMESNFTEEKILLIGDVLHTFNLNMFTEYKEMNLEAEKEKGKAILNNLKTCINGKKDFSIIEWPEIKNKKAVLLKRTNLTTYYFNNEIFNNEILTIAKNYVNRKVENGFHLNVNYNDAIDSSVAYLLDELSVFSYLIDKGLEVQLYFGTQLPILKKLATRELNLNTNLKDCVYVDASLKKT